MDETSDHKRAVISPLGDEAVLVQLGRGIRPDLHRRVRTFCEALVGLEPDGVSEWVPAYDSVCVVYDPERVSYHDLCDALLDLMESMPEDAMDEQPRTIEIPVCYGGEFGPDLEFVANQAGLSVAQTVQIHSAVEYLVYMIGFVPGFPYLGGMDQRLFTPRRRTPRAYIPAGSVGIAGGQTGVYPIATPGGWQVIGRTSLALFHPDRVPPAVLKMGDRVRFQPVTVAEFKQLQEEADESSRA